MTVENLKTRKSVPTHESGQGQIGSVDLLICNSTLLPDETAGSAIREGLCLVSVRIWVNA
jgi:hypothetical protein